MGVGEATTRGDYEMMCTRCDGTGYLNLHQIPEDWWGLTEPEMYLWVQSPDNTTDVQVCDCCGDGEEWYGQPGHHYGPDDPIGEYGPYQYNGGLCECH